MQSVFSVPVYGQSDVSARSNASNSGALNTQTIAEFQQFVTEFRENESFVYRDRLRANCLRKEWTLEVEMGHLIGWREDLASRCRNEPGEVLPLVRLPRRRDLGPRSVLRSQRCFTVRDCASQCCAESPLPDGGVRQGAQGEAGGRAGDPAAAAKREPVDAVQGARRTLQFVLHSGKAS